MMSTMFSEPDLETMQRVRCAFDPLQLSNPTKVFPRPRLGGEKPGEYVAHPLETAGIAGALFMAAGGCPYGKLPKRFCAPVFQIRFSYDSLHAAVCEADFAHRP